MQPHELWLALRKSWWVVVLAVVACVGLLVGSTTSKVTTYHSSVTLSVQPPHGTAAATSTTTGAADFNAAAVQFLVPVVQERVTSNELSDEVRASLHFLGAQTFSVAATVTPDSGLIKVTVSSADEGLILPVLDGYTERLTQYPGVAGLPIAVNILQPPLLPTVEARTTKIAVAGIEGLVIGAVVGVALALLLARLRRTRDPVAQVRDRLRLPVLGVLPRFDRGGAGDIDDFVHIAAQLRTRIAGGELRSLAFISPGAGSGRSLVAARTSGLLASTGLQMLLVDANLRDPGLVRALRDEHTYIREWNSTDLLAHTTLALSATSVPRLYFVPGTSLQQAAQADGQVSEWPVTTVASSVGHVIKDGTDANLSVIVDTPPMAGAPEVDLLVTLVDGVVLILDSRSRRKNIAALEQAVARIGELDGKIVGVIVNWTKSSKRSRRAAPKPTPARLPASEFVAAVADVQSPS